jgi:MFS transporter, DHA3 family, macrolide efflux protein
LKSDLAEELSVRSGIFHNRNFLFLFSGKIISQFGDQVYLFALAWYILFLTHSSLQMAVFLAIESIVLALLSPVGGIVADHVNRKHLLVWMDIARSIIILAVALLFWQGQLQLWTIYVSAALLGACGSVFSPAASAVIPDIVSQGDLAKAMSTNQFTTNFCAILGMVTGGILYNALGIFAIFIFNALSYLVSGILEACLSLPRKQQKPYSKSTVLQQISGLLKGIGDGFSYIAHDKSILHLLLMNTMMNFVAIPIVLVYLPYLFNVVLVAAPIQLSLSQAAVWAGMILGAFLIPVLRRHKLRSYVIVGLVVLGACSFPGILMLIPQYVPVMGNWGLCALWTVTGVCCGFAASLFVIPMYVFFQQRVPSVFRGRFWGAESSLRTFANCSGYVFAGFLAQSVPLGFIFLVIALLFFAMASWAAGLRSLKSLREEQPVVMETMAE